MTKLYIQEFRSVATIDAESGGGTILPYPPIATQVVDYTAGATNSVAFNVLTKFIQVETDAICSVRLSLASAPVSATVTDQRMAANEKQPFGVQSPTPMVISAITNT